MSLITLHKIEKWSSSEKIQNGAKTRLKKMQRYGRQRETLKSI